MPELKRLKHPTPSLKCLFFFQLCRSYYIYCTTTLSIDVFKNGELAIDTYLLPGCCTLCIFHFVKKLASAFSKWAIWGFQSSVCCTLQQLHKLVVQALREIACVCKSSQEQDFHFYLLTLLLNKVKCYTIFFILYNAG